MREGQGHGRAGGDGFLVRLHCTLDPAGYARGLVEGRGLDLGRFATKVFVYFGVSYLI